MELNRFMDGHWVSNDLSIHCSNFESIHFPFCLLRVSVCAMCSQAWLTLFYVRAGQLLTMFDLQSAGFSAPNSRQQIYLYLIFLSLAHWIANQMLGKCLHIFLHTKIYRKVYVLLWLGNNFVSSISLYEK